MPTFAVEWSKDAYAYGNASQWSLSVHQHPADASTGNQKEDSHVHALLWRSLFEVVSDLFLSVQLCINAVLCTANQHLHQYVWKPFVSTKVIIYFTFTVFITVAFEKLTHFAAFTSAQLPLQPDNAISPFYKWGTEAQKVPFSTPLVPEKVQGRCSHFM